MNDLGIYAVGNLGAKAITFLMVPLYTYFVTQPADYGYYDICLTAIFLVMPFLTLQLRDGAFRFLLDVTADEERTKIVSMVYRTLGVTILISIVITLVVDSVFHINYLWLTLALLIVMSIQEVVSQVFRGLGNTKAFVAIGMLSAFGIGIFSVAFVAMMGMGIKGIFLANILARLIAIAVVEFRVRTLRKFFSLTVSVRGILRDILKYSIPLLPGSLCWWLTGSSDRWFIQGFLGFEANGVYAVAVRFTSILFTLGIIYYQAWQETAIMQYNSSDRDKFFSKMLNSYVYVLALLLIAFSFLLKINYGWLVDGNYAASKWYIYPMSVSTAFFAISAFFDMGYQCAKDTKRTLPAIILAAMVNVGLNFILVKHLGVWGAIVTSIVTYLVLVVYRWHDMKRYFQLSISPLTAVPVLAVIAGAAPYYLDTALWQDVVALVVLMALLLLACPPALKAEFQSRVTNIMRR